MTDGEPEYRIVGQGEVIKVEVGSTLHLDCPVCVQHSAVMHHTLLAVQVSQLTDRPGSIMLWKKGHRVLTAGSMKVN